MAEKRSSSFDEWFNFNGRSMNQSIEMKLRTFSWHEGFLVVAFSVYSNIWLICIFSLKKQILFIASRIKLDRKRFDLLVLLTYLPAHRPISMLIVYQYHHYHGLLWPLGLRSELPVPRTPFTQWRRLVSSRCHGIKTRIIWIYVNALFTSRQEWWMDGRN